MAWWVPPRYAGGVPRWSCLLLGFVWWSRSLCGFHAAATMPPRRHALSGAVPRGLRALRPAPPTQRSVEGPPPHAPRRALDHDGQRPVARPPRALRLLEDGLRPLPALAHRRHARPRGHSSPARPRPRGLTDRSSASTPRPSERPTQSGRPKRGAASLASRRIMRWGRVVADLRPSCTWPPTAVDHRSESSLTPSQSHDSIYSAAVRDPVAVGQHLGHMRRRPGRVLADRGVGTGISSTRRRKRRRTLDRVAYRDRNVVERALGHLEEHRRAAMWQEKLAESHQAMVQAASVERYVRAPDSPGRA